MQQQDAITAVEPRAVPPAQGWAWITQGFNLFKRAPGTWIGVLVLWVVIYLFATVIPLGGLVTTLLSAVFQAGWMLGCRSLDTGGELKVEHLFAGFRGDKLGELVIVGAIYLGGLIVAGGLVLVLVGGSMLSLFMGDTSPQAIHFGVGAVVGALLFIALMVPLMMAMWFAPALVVFQNQTPVEAMKLSFFACWRNIVPFLVYGLIMLVLVILASIPLLLGFLVLGPVIVASIYTSYRDVFSSEAQPVVAAA